MYKLIFIIVVILIADNAIAQGPKDIPSQAQGVSADESALRDVLSNYQNGLTTNDEKLFFSSLGKELIMFSGNFSADTTKWQAHLFLTGDNLKRWASNFVRNVGPHKSKFEFLSFHIRNNAAIVVTKETGNNKFRK